VGPFLRIQAGAESRGYGLTRCPQCESYLEYPGEKCSYEWYEAEGACGLKFSHVAGKK
jgi:hypothetical protein